jgi:hypothetical protein
MTTDAKVQRRLLKRAWGSSRPSLFLSGMSEMGHLHRFWRVRRMSVNGGISEMLVRYLIAPTWQRVIIIARPCRLRRATADEDGHYSER